MKSSRRRFAEFRDKIRAGILDPERYADPSQKRDDRPFIGGKHGDSPAIKHVFRRKKKQLLAEYRVLLQGYYGAVALLFTVITLSTFVTILTPIILKLLVYYVAKTRPLSEVTAKDVYYLHVQQWLPTDPGQSLAFLAGVMIVAAIITIALDWVRLLATQRINFRVAGSLRQRLHRHLIRLPLSLLSDYKTGGLVSRIMGDTDQVVGGINNALVVPYAAFIRVVGIIFLLFFTNWKLAACIALLIPPILLIHLLLFKRLRPMWRNIQDDRSMISARLTDMYGGIRVVRSFQREFSELKEFGATQDTLIRKQQYTAILGRILGTGWGIFGPAIGVVIIWYGGSMVINGSMELGTLVMFQTLIFMLIGPVTNMIDSFQNLQQNLGALDRVIDVLEQPTDMPDKPNATALLNPVGAIRFEEVYFGYKPERTVLNGISLEVPAGTTIAIVGPSGSGKSTLVNLVARFFDINRGAIKLDGVDIRDIRIADYRALFAMVLQDVYLFDGTVADNIAYGKRHATREQIIEAARKANAHDFISEFDLGYDTIVGERGNKLSGGQKQRISIARAILANPRILILDEATSSLDSHSEHLIQESLRELMTSRTTFVIAHRLSTIMHADRIVVLVEGRIVEQGTHEELLERRGVYHEMFTQQFERHRDPNLERIEWVLAEPKA